MTPYSEAPWDQRSLWEDQKLMTGVRLDYGKGWQWHVDHFDGETWARIDSGTAPSFEMACTSLQRVFGEFGY